MTQVGAMELAEATVVIQDVAHTIGRNITLWDAKDCAD
jgi:hypothetical protein